MAIIKTVLKNTMMEEIIGKIFSDINHTSVFLDHSSRAIEVKQK